MVECNVQRIKCLFKKGHDEGKDEEMDWLEFVISLSQDWINHRLKRPVTSSSYKLHDMAIFLPMYIAASKLCSYLCKKIDKHVDLTK